MKNKKTITNTKKIKEELFLLPIKTQFYNKFYYKSKILGIADKIDFKNYL
jgi:hypothetical protein